MILRRIIQNIRNQNWFTVTVEVFVVVVGIYLGLQAQQWSEERADRVEEQEYLLDMESDILASIEMAKEHQQKNEEILKSLEYILKIDTGSNLAEEKDTFEKAVLKGLFTVGIFYIQNSTYQEMASSGKLLLLQNKELRKALTYLENKLISRLRDNEKNIYDTMIGLMDPMLVNNYPVDQIMRFDDNFENFFVDKDLFRSVAQENLIAFLSERRNRNIIIYRISMQDSNLDWTIEIIKQYELILELIRAE